VKRLVLAVAFLIASLGCQQGRDYAKTVAGGLDKARRTEVRASLQTLGTAIERFQIDRGHYPDRLEELPEVGSGRSRSTDPWGAELRYRRTDGGYEVRCVGPDGTEGTEDDIVLRDGQVE
jgi:hypothetical protein